MAVVTEVAVRAGPVRRAADGGGVNIANSSLALASMSAFPPSFTSGLRCFGPSAQAARSISHILESGLYGTQCKGVAESRRVARG